MRRINVEDIRLKLAELNLRRRQEEARALIERTPIFVITGLGRSGTSFLAHLLSQATSHAVYHETRSDRSALIRAYQSPAAAHDYIQNARLYTVGARIQLSRCNAYGEVNSYLRYHVSAIQALWDAQMIHLVRDGRDVVRSMMNRQTYTPVDAAHSGQIQPAEDDPWVGHWPQMTRFQKIAWYWAATNQYLLQYQLPLAHFEQIIASYDYFVAQILAPLSIQMECTVWESYRNQRQNVSRSTAFPSWPEWTAEQQRSFTEICGETMAALDYPM